MPFTDTDVRDWVGPDAYSRALALVANLQDVTWGEAARAEDLVASAQTAGSQAYVITLYRMRGVFSSTCTCPDRRNCVHAAALALAVRPLAGAPASVSDPVTEPAPAPGVAPAASPDWQARLAAWATPTPAAPAPAVRATFAYRLRWRPGPEGFAELQLQVNHASGASHQALAWHLYSVGPTDAEADQIVEPVIRRIRARKPVFRDGETRTAVSWLVLPDESLEELLPRLALHPRVEDERRRPLRIHPTLALRASLAFSDGPTGPQLRPVIDGPLGRVERADAVLFGPPGARWATWRGEVYRVDAAAEAAWADTAPIDVPEHERAAFERRWLPALVEAGVLVDARGAPLGEWPQGTPRPQLVLEESGEALVARVGFVYGEERVEADPSDGPAGLVGGPDGALLRRDPVAEAQWLASLREVLPGDVLVGEAALDFLESYAPSLVGAGWEIVGRERLRVFKLTGATPRGRLSITTGADWFDVHSEVDFGGQTVGWQSLAQALERGVRYVKLGGGEWARVPAEWLATQRRLRERLGARASAANSLEALRVPCHQAPVIASLLDAAEDVVVDAGWKVFRARLETFGGIAEVPVPQAFQGTLRTYQQQGLNYLAFLRDHGLHGILADDMGLGKTVQAAALLAANHPNDEGPSLIVAPTSVVANWEAELRRFVPSLRVLRLHGPDRDLAAIATHDVVITTYATARLDIEAHRRHTYHTVLLDEAQAIKNARSLTAVAMRRLKARHRLCLTGTPIENDTRDLWSLFAFLMPGMLGSDDLFRTQYANPIALGEPGPRKELRTRIAPFILRRLKAQVAPELPPRTDITHFCDLSPGQRRAYDALLTGARDRIQRTVASEGLERSRITILDALLKLRQVCCHPALLGAPDTLHLASGKLDAALALIQDLIAGGHRALVFSQFTSMLAILRAQLDGLGIPYEYLDGGTRDRQERVDRFNAGGAPLFLISLKAGGSGLNLTGADYVIHYDPWWNPASEDQATDRAHRIGQTRPVFNYKLVARDTIEEKLVVLQTEKRGLVRDILATDAAGKLLTSADVDWLFA